MEENGREFLKNLCNLFIAALLAVLPLYTGGTYYHLGDTKYLLFRNISLVCLAMWAAVGALVLVGNTWKKSGAAGQKRRYSPVDFCMAAYGIAVLISFLFSAYRQTAWAGYRDWYMGALSQLLFVWIYFFVSRNYDGAAFPVYLGEAALFAVALTGLLNRLEIDPFGLLEPYGAGDWEYGHMLSTVGNINWLCGYFSVSLAFPLTGFLYGKKGVKSVLLYIVSAAGLLLLIFQGSDGGVALAAVGMGLALFMGRKKPEIFGRGILLGAGTCLLIPVMAALVAVRGSEKTIPADGNTYEMICWRGWWLVGLILLLLWLFMKKAERKWRNIFIKIFLGLAALGALTGAGFYLVGMDRGDDWGTGRGGLWRLAWEGFLRADGRQKFIGAGPDCFAEYIYGILPAHEIINPIGHWAEAVFANAHNEWLNHLVNLGILGTMAYLSIFIFAVFRYRQMPLGIFVLVMYGIYSLVSFQQTVSTPLLFLILGICESRLRLYLDSENRPVYNLS